MYDMDKPVDLRQERQTSNSVSALPTRLIRNRSALSTFTLRSSIAESKSKYKASLFQVNNPITIDQLNLVQYAFDRDA